MQADGPRARGSRRAGAEAGEFGRSRLTLRDGGGTLLEGLPAEQQCWMSHRDTVFEPPPGFTALASSTESPVAAVEDTKRGLYGIQFHPEVVHTPYGTEILTRFLRDVVGCREKWSPASLIEEQVARSAPRSATARAICGLSGGVDSATAALLVHRAIGDQLTCVFVDHGMMRKDEAEQVVTAFREQSRHPAGPRRRGGPLPRAARRGRGPRDQAEDHRRGVHPRLRGGGRQGRGRALPRPGHALLGRDRVRGRRPGGGHHQVPPQRRWPARGDGDRAGRAAAHALQGRGPRRRGRARAARALGLAPAVPRAGPRDPRRRRRGHPRAARDRPRGRRDPAGGDPRRRALPRALAVVLRPAGRPLGRRPGRRALLRAPDRDPRRHLRRRDDRGLGPPALRPAGAGLQPDHQRGPRGQPGHARPHLEAARHDRVGIGPSGYSAAS